MIHIALLRGINVGGRNALPMKELVRILEHLGARDVATYIQSGNAAFACDTADRVQLADAVRREIRKRHGFEPHVLLLARGDIDKAIAKNPFPDALAEPKSLHVGFLASTPVNPNLGRLSELKEETERFHLGESVFYLHAPKGIGRSKLAASAERLLGVPMTDRNWNTVCRLQELAQNFGGIER